MEFPTLQARLIIPPAHADTHVHHILEPFPVSQNEIWLDCCLQTFVPTQGSSHQGSITCICVQHFLSRILHLLPSGQEVDVM